MANLTRHGIQSIRVIVSTQGDFYCNSIYPPMETNENDLLRLSYRKIDFMLNATRQYNTETSKLKVVMVLSNFWHWTGGLSYYVNTTCVDSTTEHIPCIGVNGTEEEYIAYTRKFYSCTKAREELKKLFYNMANHVNEYSGKKYMNDDAIMSWEIVNEAIPNADAAIFRAWAYDMVSYMKSVDTNHLVTIGSMGTKFDPEFRTTHEISGVDYITFSVHAKEWGWIVSSGELTSLENAKAKTKDYIDEIVKIAKLIRKPLILNVFEYPRDNNECKPRTATKDRDEYFKHVLSIVGSYATQRLIVGAFFWGWSDHYEPKKECTEKWVIEDPVIGDRTDRPQGILSVNEFDESTMTIIREAANALKDAHLKENLPNYLWILYAAVIGGVLLFIIAYTIAVLKNDPLESEKEAAKEEEKSESEDREKLIESKKNE
eukprot:TRINITY_DN7138_c0_g1_i2.p1 TRINITY_DN7138_c0_g1~~TRINITY_DN7138_c0_g1_i2.p1  ORF type:complete len:431 (-),score=105.42 TRINITY_DN7138_c0_g1_i2:156-1448(-)